MDIKMDVVKVENTLTKLKTYRSIESDNFDSIKRQLNKLFSTYSSSNSSIIKEKAYFITNKFPSIKNIHYNNHLVLNKNMNMYINTAAKVSRIFNDIV